MQIFIGLLNLEILNSIQVECNCAFFLSRFVYFIVIYIQGVSRGFNNFEILSLYWAH